MCESYFVLGLTSVDYKKYRGREGTKQLEDFYMKIQTSYEQQGWALQRCPTCIECAIGKKYQDWLASSDPAILSLCHAASFEDGQPPPLYIQETTGRDRWTLAQGVGPKTLELDRTRSGRLYKPAIRNIIGDLSATVYTSTECTASGGTAAHANMLSAVESALSRAAQQCSGVADALAKALLLCSPVFSRWPAASGVLDAAEAAAATQENVEEKDGDEAKGGCGPANMNAAGIRD